MNTQSTIQSKPHLVVVGTYTGSREHLCDEVDGAGEWLGLPLNELVKQNQIRITVLNWNDWLPYEQPGSFLDWMPFPVTRPAEQRQARPAHEKAAAVAITVRSIPAHDPAFGLPLSMGMSPLTYALLADSDPLFLMSYALNACLEALHAKDPIDSVIVSIFGGLGYVPQVSRATGAGMRDVSFGVVVTDTSHRRQVSNGEGVWTRPATTRRQMEDLSLALADVAVWFGPRGRETARLGRQGGTLLKAPRWVRQGLAEDIKRAAEDGEDHRPLKFFIDAPLQGSAGTLAMLDAARLLRERNERLEAPISCAGTNMVFGPAKPRDFKDYWSGRGWVRNLIETGYWRWSNEPRSDVALNVRVCPSHFDHLPTLWEELARGSFVLCSAAAAEGLASPETLPSAAYLGEQPGAETIAQCMAALEASGASEVNRLRREMCHTIAEGLNSASRREDIATFCSGIDDLIARRYPAPRLGEVARLLLDRKVPLASVPVQAEFARFDAKPTLTVAVACYEMAELVVETIESVWSSVRIPDEVILVDDGSTGERTQAAIARLEQAAASRGLPLIVLRQANRGLCGARNAALAMARSSHISFLDGDDLIGPEFYGLAIEIFNTNPELGGVAAWAAVFGEGVPDAFWNAPQAELPLLLVENTVIVPCVMPTELVRSLGGYDPGQRYNYEDWELAVRLLAAGRPIVTIPRYLQRYRVRADSLLRTMSEVQNQVMREKLFSSHRDVCAAFGPEVALQIEHRLFLRMAAGVVAQPAPGSWAVRARKAYTKLRLLGAPFTARAR